MRLSKVGTKTSTCTLPKLREFLLSRQFPLAVEAQEIKYCRKKKKREKEQATGVSVLHWIGPVYALLLKNLMNILLAVPGAKQQTSDPFKSRATGAFRKMLCPIHVCVSATRNTHHVLILLNGWETTESDGMFKLVRKKAASLLLQRVLCTTSYWNSYSNATGAPEPWIWLFWSSGFQQGHQKPLATWLGSQAERVQHQAEAGDTPVF